MHEVLVNRLGGLSLPRKSVVRLSDRPDMTLDVYRGRKTTIQHMVLRKHFTKVAVVLLCTSLICLQARDTGSVLRIYKCVVYKMIVAILFR